ncbi:hypothetical protein MMPV_001150 [Pyropia vietnamensis]
MATEEDVPPLPDLGDLAWDGDVSGEGAPPASRSDGLLPLRPSAAAVAAASATADAAAATDGDTPPHPLPSTVADGVGSATARALEAALYNELHAPALLPYPDVLVADTRRLLDAAAEAIAAEEAVAARASPGAALATHARRVEAGRVTHLLRATLRARLRKVEATAEYLAAEPAARVLLSAAEQDYADGYVAAVGEALTGGFLGMLPEKVRGLVADSDGRVGIVPRPRLDTFVWCRRTPGGAGGELVVAVSDGPDSAATVSIADGDTVCVRYRCIQSLVEAGELQLI